MQFDTDKFKVWKLPHPIILHWVLNPGLAFNELVLGQRLPKVMLIDKTSEEAFPAGQYVPCPHCETLNDGRLWSKGNALGHWFGYVCPACHGKIPCLWNLTSLVILTLTFPIWIWLKLFGEEKWLEKEKARFTTIDAGKAKKITNATWLKMGLAFGALMFCFMAAMELYRGQLTLYNTLVLAALWLVGGLIFGGLMKLILGRQSGKAK